MNASTLDDLRPRPRDRLSRGLLLAIAAHVVLVVALSISVAWRSSEPAGVEAELWAAVPKAAAPKAVEPEPPKPQPAPTPEPPKPTPKVETPPPPPQVNRDAEIAREKREEKEKLERQRIEDERKEAAARREQERKLAEQRKAEAEKEKREAERKQAEKEKKAEAERQARVEAQRNERLKRIMGEAGATGAENATGSAQQSAGPSASYAGRIKARIKPNITFYEDVPSNPTAVVEVRAAPDGSIVGRRLVKSSGVAAWDDAVLRAIDKTEVLPRDTDGRVPSPIEIAFRPRDL